ncbi:hypothetical protein ACIO6U_02745 [Streptomyces sp. NPDC087422]|uniref:hypothetical protein n=1 Tax=Streptomyces sp. NPDC087422 TaxID=3365786 RepID=UPI00381DA44F
MGLFSRNNDQNFHDQRASDIQTAVNNGDIDGATRLVSHLIIEEGAAGLGPVTEAINRGKRT